VTRVAVVDIGSNSTRLLVADVEAGRVTELRRESVVTRLGEGVEATGALGEEPQQRVFAVLDAFAAAISRHGADVRRVVLTSAVRDASNGAQFADTVRSRYGLEGSILSGDEEARLSFLGATATRDDSDPLLVIDIGGGSTEMIVGARRSVAFHASMQVGVVRHSERYLHSDPPARPELEALAADARSVIDASVPRGVRAEGAVAVAGTATQCASVDLALDPYDSERVEGHTLSATRIAEIRDRLAAVPLARRREITGLDPSRAPTIVAGTVVLLEILGAFALTAVQVSERDILWGVALECTFRGVCQECP
jgi:exopolyphosphatase/guanosine-5'-triphosphate,3'-diphosphate pyrophosphatase